MNRKLIDDIRIDRKNNSTKSFLILFFYRVMHRASSRAHHKIILTAWRILRGLVYFFLGIDAQISYKAVIGSDIRLLHSGNGVVISAKAVIGDHETIYHQVTIGINENKPIELQKVVIQDNCYLSAGCKVISCVVGKGSRIGPNAVVYRDLPENSLYVSQNQLLN